VLVAADIFLVVCMLYITLSLSLSNEARQSQLLHRIYCGCSSLMTLSIKCV